MHLLYSTPFTISLVWFSFGSGIIQRRSWFSTCSCFAPTGLHSTSDWISVGPFGRMLESRLLLSSLLYWRLAELFFVCFDFVFTRGGGSW